MNDDELRSGACSAAASSRNAVLAPSRVPIRTWRARVHHRRSNESSEGEHRLIPLLLQVLPLGESIAGESRAGCWSPILGNDESHVGAGRARGKGGREGPTGPPPILTRRGKINLRARRSRARDLLVRRYSAGATRHKYREARLFSQSPRSTGRAGTPRQPPRLRSRPCPGSTIIFLRRRARCRRRAGVWEKKGETVARATIRQRNRGREDPSPPPPRALLRRTNKNKRQPQSSHSSLEGLSCTSVRPPRPKTIESSVDDRGDLCEAPARHVGLDDARKKAREDRPIEDR
jgi:hypothetical protein